MVTTNCLFPAQTEQLSFYLFDIYGTAGARGFLYITTEPAVNEPRHDKTNKMSVRPAKTQIRLIRVFAVRSIGS